MHAADEFWWYYCKTTYPKSFDSCSVLEVGSQNINGSVRIHFTNNIEYIGVDWVAGKDVDIVCLAHEMKFDHQFDTIISSNTLEHDPYWRKSLRVMVSYLKPTGMMFLSWGGPHTSVHRLECSPLGKFHPKSMKIIQDYLEKLGLTIVECISSEDFLKLYAVTLDDQGCINLVARR